MPDDLQQLVLSVAMHILSIWSFEKWELFLDVDVKTLTKEWKIFGRLFSC